ncbi:ferredoxin family protein [Desulfitobacterium chlororespirans]|uniref:Ferredoxin-like protein FixX n=1 Tax=Desulfitobacterium chlororespirans DSM 11544 TaxID=1121395 RepID=A0A1M7SFB2_9FIRM|nr:ferredoxin family protein [Desulfitobacterium chlororespirans]SHN57167.1 Ferredoxin-like protein FixX [Desulfitobacterium chlororespirans DSM 11544]
MNTANTVNVDAKLGLDKFYVDEENAHIVLKKDIDSKEYHKLMLACPAGLYKQDDKGGIHFDYAGCLECGTCRVLCGTTLLEKWEFPVGTLGIEFRWG